MTIRAEPMARGASGPAAPESAIVHRKMNVPTNSVRSLGARGIAVFKLALPTTCWTLECAGPRRLHFGWTCLGERGRAAIAKMHAAPPAGHGVGTPRRADH